MVVASVLWCEVGYYYFVFYFNCSSWPGMVSDNHNGFEESRHINDQIDSQKLTKLLVIADTHIMGPIKSVKIDKLRREWQMKQAFSISNSIFQPDVIVFMGDLIDEGSFSRDEYFNKACDDFDRIFAYDERKQERIIIPGNHDVGFHDQMRNFPFLMKRFQDRYSTTSGLDLVRTPKTQHLNLVVSNSMSFYNDTCPFCSTSMRELNLLQDYFNNIIESKPRDYVSPILLGHIPLFRKNDLNCTYPATIREKVSKDNIEGEEVLHKVSSRAILSKLRPRLALSGHTHMLCHTEHLVQGSMNQEPVYELTMSSYNHKYAELKPGFVLMTANSTHVFTKHCNLIEEWVVLSIYIATILILVFRLIFAFTNKSDESIISQDKLTLHPSKDETKDQ